VGEAATLAYYRVVRLTLSSVRHIVRINRMIVVTNFLADLLIHFVVLLLLGAYVRYIVGAKGGAFVVASFLAALLITYLNHTYFPRLTLSGTFQTSGEGFEVHLCAVDALCGRRAACPYGE
jgi:hypothetical protein